MEFVFDPIELCRRFQVNYMCVTSDASINSKRESAQPQRAGAFLLSPRVAHTHIIGTCHFPLSDWHISERAQRWMPNSRSAAFLIAGGRGNLSAAERNLHARKFNDITSRGFITSPPL